MSFRREFLAVTLCLALTTPALGQELPFSHYTPDRETNPLPSADVNRVFQDSQGFMWMAVFSSGVARYDGRRLDLYTTGDGLKDLGVWEIIEDKSGRLWVGSNAGLVVSDRPLAAYPPGTRVQFTSQYAGVELTQTTVLINRLAVDQEGALWAGTPGDGIIRYRMSGGDRAEPDTISTDIYDEGENRTVRSVVARRNGSVVVSVRGGDLMFFEGGDERFELLGQADGAPGQSINVLYESPDGHLWGGCRDGLIWTLDESGGRRIVNVSRDLEANVSGILQTDDGSLWAVSEGSGVLKIDMADRSKRRVFTVRNGLLSNNVHHVTQDHEGNLWFAQVGGVSKLRANYPAFENYTARSHEGEEPALPARGINVVLPRADGEALAGIWAGTSDGGIAWIAPDGDVVHIATDRGLRGNWVNGLLVDDSGRLWVGTFSGINCLSLGAAPPPPPAPEWRQIGLNGLEGIMAGYRRTTIYSASRLPLLTGNAAQTVESLWFPGFHNLFCRVGEQWYIFRETSGLPSTSFHAVTVDGGGRVWVGTEDHGLYRSTEPLTVAALRNLKTEPVPHQLGDGAGTFAQRVEAPVFERVWSVDNGAPTNQIEKLIWRGNSLWVGTQKGLFVIEGEPPVVASRFTRAEGLGAENVSSMAFSPTTGSLWIGTNSGLTEIDPLERTTGRSVTKQDGLLDNEIWWLGSVATDREGAVYFGTSKGLAVYRPFLDRGNPVPPLLRFRETRFRQNAMGGNELFVEYSALSYSDERLVRYKTRLIGYDEDWSPATAEAKIRYTNLPALVFAKDYVFEVTASNDDGQWAEAPIRYTVSVQPAWWFRWWAVLAQAFLVAGMAFGAHRVRTHKLKQHARQLEQTVAERTAEIREQAQELQDKNIELEDKNVQILRAQEQLIVQEKLASLGSLTAGIAHEIKNPLNFVNNFAELSNDLIDELREDLEKNVDKLDEESAQNLADILEDLAGNVTRINDHGKRADGIVKSMLLHSRSDGGDYEEINVTGLLDENFNLAFHSMRGKDKEFNVKVERDYDESVGKITAKAQDLGRVFLNIIDNAFLAMRDKQKSAEGDYAPVIRLSCRWVEDKLEIRIRDNGKGMPPDVREKVFNPFFTTRPTGEGTGLGMSISYDVVVGGHGGDIKVESEEGEFTEFIITLPKKSGTAGQTPAG